MVATTDERAKRRERAVTTESAAAKERAVVAEGAVVNEPAIPTDSIDKSERAASNESAETEVRATSPESAEQPERSAVELQCAEDTKQAVLADGADPNERAELSESAEPVELPIHRLGYPQIHNASHHLWDAQQAGWPDHLPHEAWRDLVLVKNQEKAEKTSSADLPAFQPDYAPNYMATENDPKPEMPPVMAPKVRR